MLGLHGLELGIQSESLRTRLAARGVLPACLFPCLLPSFTRTPVGCAGLGPAALHLQRPYFQARSHLRFWEGHGFGAGVGGDTAPPSTLSPFPGLKPLDGRRHPGPEVGCLQRACRFTWLSSSVLTRRAAWGKSLPWAACPLSGAAAGGLCCFLQAANGNRSGPCLFPVGCRPPLFSCETIFRGPWRSRP